MSCFPRSPQVRAGVRPIRSPTVSPTVRSADRIYVSSHRDKVIEHGTHDELMALDGHYAELFRLQAAAYSLQD